MLAMKSTSIIRWCLLTVCAVLIAGCATNQEDQKQGQAKKEGWHPANWINM
jgi:hypothetical protein